MPPFSSIQTVDSAAERTVDLSFDFATWRERTAKRAFDFLGALLILVLCSPIILLVAVGVWCSGGPMLFSHERVGENGKRFRCLKFRTMRCDASERLQELLANDPLAREEWARDFKLKNDPRITRIGGFLRRTSLDELPQLFNVLSGDMGLVGPRPVVAEELARYGYYSRYYLSTRPGMTGLWQVSGRNNTTYRRRIALDCAYVRHQCLGLDMKILVRTIGVVFRAGRGAY